MLRRDIRAGRLANRGAAKNKRNVWKGAIEPEQKEYGRCTKCHLRRRVEWACCPNCGGTEYNDVALCYVAYTVD
jgi:hypothetical protein